MTINLSVRLLCLSVSFACPSLLSVRLFCLPVSLCLSVSFVCPFLLSVCPFCLRPFASPSFCISVSVTFRIFACRPDFLSCSPACQEQNKPFPAICFSKALRDQQNRTSDSGYDMEIITSVYFVSFNLFPLLRFPASFSYEGMFQRFFLLTGRMS